MERPGRYRYRSLWARKIRKCLPLGEAIQLQGNQRSRIGVCIELAGDSTWTSFLVPFWLVLWMVFNLYDAEASWPNETRPCTKIIQSFMVSKARTLKAAESFPRKMLITIDLLPTSQQRHSGASAVCRWFSMWSQTHSLKFLHSIISTLQWKPFSLQTPLNKIWMFLCKPVPPANYHQDSRWMGGN